VQIGRFQIDPLIDGRILTDTAYLYPTVAPDRWSIYDDLLTGDGRILTQAGGYLLRSGEHTILLDNGVGPDPAPPFTGGALLATLADHGVAPEDVTVMLFTHLHFDHIGWTTHGDAVVFPNARHVANRDDWEYFFSGRYPGVRIERPHDFPMRRLAPLVDRVELWNDNSEIVPGVAVRRATGHTPGHAIIEISSDGERGLLIGDLAHHQAELLEDDWTGVADIEPDAARRSTLQIAREIVSDGLPFAAAHFPGLAWGRIEQVGERRRWVSLEPERSAAALAAASA
jgi:glyoxylase-like metal-dependent hydrolase (beta-lactamase superfamily II)